MVQRNTNPSRTVLGAALLFLLLPLFLVVTKDVVVWAVQNQNKEKTIEKLDERNTPIKVLDLKKNQVSALGKSFEGGDDWLKNLSFTFQNSSDKPIVYIEFHLNFPETKKSGDTMSYRWEVGQIPGSRVGKSSNPITLNPGEVLYVNLDEEYLELTRFLETRHSPKDLKEAELRIGFVVFADKTAWAAGDFLRQDPNRPSKFTNVGSTPSSPNN